MTSKSSVQNRKVSVAGSTWGGGSCQVQIEQGSGALTRTKGRGGPIDRRSRRASRMNRKARKQAGKQGKQASKHARPPRAAVTVS